MESASTTEFVDVLSEVARVRVMDRVGDLTFGKRLLAAQMQWKRGEYWEWNRKARPKDHWRKEI
jgi:hypothetical protein